MDKTEKNANAYSHALQFACLEYPFAFGYSYEDFPLDKAKDLFLDRTTVATLAIGQMKRLQGAISIVHIDHDTLELKFLFRHEFLGRATGKFLLESALSFSEEERNAKRIGLEVFTTNHHAINLYRRLGFDEYFSRDSEKGVLSMMSLEGEGSIEEARRRLHASYV